MGPELVEVVTTSSSSLKKVDEEEDKKEEDEKEEAVGQGGGSRDETGAAVPAASDQPSPPNVAEDESDDGCCSGRRTTTTFPTIDSQPHPHHHQQHRDGEDEMTMTAATTRTCGGRRIVETQHQQQQQKTAAQPQQPQGGGMAVRNASGGGELKEVFLKMEYGTRVSRSIRAEWILDHLNRTIEFGEKQMKQKGLSLFGFLLDGKSVRMPKGERLKVGPNTAVTFLADTYRLVFILDLSPSSFVIDDHGCVLYRRLIQSLTSCLKSLVVKTNVPCAQCEFKPNIFVSVCLFTPFPCFTEENVLCQSVPVGADNVDALIDDLIRRLNLFIDRLIQFSQPHMRNWNSNRRRNRKMENQKQQHEDQWDQRQLCFRSTSRQPGASTDQGFIQSDWALIFMLRMGLMSVQMMGQAGRSLANIVIITDGVCGVPDPHALQGALGQYRLNGIACSFIKLRQGSLRGPVLGHVGFPELFRFIANSTFGSFLDENDLERAKGSDGLNAVQRALLTWSFRKGLPCAVETTMAAQNKIAKNNLMEEPLPMHTNFIRNKRFSRTYESTSLGRLLAIRFREGFSIRQLDELRRTTGGGADVVGGGDGQDENQRCNIGGNEDHHHHQLQHQQQQSALLIRLALVWRPQVLVEYNIYAPRQRTALRKCKLHVDVLVEAAQMQYTMRNLLGERRDPSSLRSALISLSDGDALLLHLDSFNTETHYWNLPNEVDRSVALFELKPRATHRVELADRYEALRNSKFISYWQPLSNIEEGIWQKWMHTHALRLVLTHDHPLPERIFTTSPHQSKGRFVQCTAEMAFNELHNHLKRWASFVLVRDQSYVCFLHEENTESRSKKPSGMKAPDQFCLIRTSLDIPCVLIRLCFPPGVNPQTRDEVLNQFSDSLSRLRIVRELHTISLLDVGRNAEAGLDDDCHATGPNLLMSSDVASSLVDGGSGPIPHRQLIHVHTIEVPSIFLVQKPFERVLIRYRNIPRELHRIVRLEWTESLQEKRDMILHNATAKFLTCRRHVWQMNGMFLKNTVPTMASIEFIMQTLLRLRLNQGFRLAWNKNGIITLIRQMPTTQNGMCSSQQQQQPLLEQCVLFGPTIAIQSANQNLLLQPTKDGHYATIATQVDALQQHQQQFDANRKSSMSVENCGGVGEVLGTAASLIGNTAANHQTNGNVVTTVDKYGTMESSKSNICAVSTSTTAMPICSSWPQIVVEIWSEPSNNSSGTSCIGVEKAERTMVTGPEQSREALLAENELLIRTLFTFDQLMTACNSRLWCEKPFVLSSAARSVDAPFADAGATIATGKAMQQQPPPSSSTFANGTINSNGSSDRRRVPFAFAASQQQQMPSASSPPPSQPVQFCSGAFNLSMLLQNATQRELMLLPAMGYAENDPHSLTRLSLLLKSLQQELTEFCDVCIELTDEQFFSECLTEMEKCLGQSEWANGGTEHGLVTTEDANAAETELGFFDEREQQQQRMYRRNADEEDEEEEELEQIWRLNLPPADPAPERFTCPAIRWGSIAGGGAGGTGRPAMPLPPLARHFSLGQHLYRDLYASILNLPTPKTAFPIGRGGGGATGSGVYESTTAFVLPTMDNTANSSTANLFTESADERTIRQLQKQQAVDEEQQTMPVPSGYSMGYANAATAAVVEQQQQQREAFVLQQQQLLASQRSTSVPLLPRNLSATVIGGIGRQQQMSPLKSSSTHKDARITPQKKFVGGGRIAITGSSIGFSSIAAAGGCYPMTDGCNAPTPSHSMLAQKRASMSEHKSPQKETAFLLNIEEPKKKLSAPASGGVSPALNAHHLISSRVHNNNNRMSMFYPHQMARKLSAHQKASLHQQQQQQPQQQQQQRTLRIYAKRLNDWRLLVFVLAKDARVCRQMMHTRQQNTFPVLAFFCDKPLMAQHFVLNTRDGCAQPPPPWIVQNFEAKSRMSVLANLREQIHVRECLDAASAAHGPNELDAFFLTACSLTAANNGVFEARDVSELAAQYLPQFRLLDHCENVFEAFLFTKAFIGAVYACLGQQLFVPAHVLADALDYRCEHTNIEIGSINEILRDTCFHLQRANKITSGDGTIQAAHYHSRKRRLNYSGCSGASIATCSSSAVCSSASTSSTSTCSSCPECSIPPSKRLRLPHLAYKRQRVSTSHGRSSGDETLVQAATASLTSVDNSKTAYSMQQNNKGKQKSAAAIGARPPPQSVRLPENCADQFEDFRCAFEQLLRQHNFYRCPGVSNYFFYWPAQRAPHQEHSLSAFNLPSLEDYIQITMPNPLYSPQPAGAITTTGNTCDAHMFSRQSSTRHPTVRENGIGDGGERQQSQRGRKASASAAAVPLADRRRRSTNPPEKRHVSKLMDGHSSTETPAAAQHQQIASELCSIQSPCSRQSSSVSWEQRGEDEDELEEMDDSEQSSLAGELLCPERWPLFIQFYVAIQSPFGPMESSPVEFIPNCLKQIADRCHHDLLHAMLPTTHRQQCPVVLQHSPMRYRFPSDSGEADGAPTTMTTDFLQFGRIRVNIDMYVLTWPLPTQSPYGGEQQHSEMDDVGGTAIVVGGGGRTKITTATAASMDERRAGRSAAAAELVNGGEMDELFALEYEENPKWMGESFMNNRKSGRNQLADGGQSDLLLMGRQQQSTDDEQIFERKVEMLRQIPAEERRLLRRLQRNMQKMLKTEHVLITSRAFDACQDYGTLLRVVQFIREEVDSVRVATTASGGVAADEAGATTSGAEQTLARFERCSKELVLVTEPEEGMRRLAEKLDGLGVEYCRLKRLPAGRIVATAMTANGNTTLPPTAGIAMPFELEALMENTKILFYSCGVENVMEFARTRYESICQFGSSFKRVREANDQHEDHATPTMPMAKYSIGAKNKKRHIASATASECGIHFWDDEETSEAEEAEDEKEIEAEDEEEEEGEEDAVDLLEDGTGQEDAEDGNHYRIQRHHSSTITEDGGTIAELTMPLNDSGQLDILSQIVDELSDLTLGGGEDGARSRRNNGCARAGTGGDEQQSFSKNRSWIERKQLLHDFWLIVQIEQNRGSANDEAAAATATPLSVNIYFCERSFLLHDQLFENACRLVDEQIRLVNQELLLERMHQTEECDSLLLEHDSFLKGSAGPIGASGAAIGVGATAAAMHALDSLQGSVATRSAQNVPGEALSRRHTTAGMKFGHQANRPNSLLLDMMPTTATTIANNMPAIHSVHASAIAAAAAVHARNNSLAFSDEDEHSEITDFVRYKFRPGHFACELVWHCWFPIHPRLQPSRVFGGSGNDIGFKALRLGLEGLAVRNRSNMYVYKESNGNVVYMRLHCTDESVLANIPTHGPGWVEEVRQHCAHCILLAVHGVRPPGEEITVQLRSVLQRKLNARTLEEIQNALLKNAHIRLEGSDIRFIQRDPNKPTSVFFFTIPHLAQRHLGSVKFYLSQQMLTFCIAPKFREREQSGCAITGAAGMNRMFSKYSMATTSTTTTTSRTGSSNRYFSGGGGGISSLALSLAGTPTIEQEQQPPQSQQFATMNRMEQHQREKGPGPHAFVPYVTSNSPPNPPDYVPTFYLVNKPPGEGKRDTGIACLEVKLIDWDGRLLQNVESGRLDAESHRLLYPGAPNALEPLQRVARLHELSRCVHVENPFECNPVHGTCALFQFNMWQNGNVGVDELQGRLKMCVQQAICDLVTEFGLLSNTLFETLPIGIGGGGHSMRSKTGSIGNKATSAVNSTSRLIVLSQPQISTTTDHPPLHTPSTGSLKPCASDVPISGQKLAAAVPFHHHHEEFGAGSVHNFGTGTTTAQSPVKAFGGSSSFMQHQQQQNQPPMVDGQQQQQRHPHEQQPQQPPPLRHPITMPVLNRMTTTAAVAQHQQTSSTASIVGSSSTTVQQHPHPLQYRPQQSPVQFSTGPQHQQLPAPQPLQTATSMPQQQQAPQQPEGSGEFLRADFVHAADHWFSHVINATKGTPEMSHSVRKYQFRLDCDASGKKIIQVVSEKLRQLLRAERVVICRTSFWDAPTRKRLETLRSVNSLLEPVERDLGRPVSAPGSELDSNISITCSNSASDSSIELVLLAYGEQLLAQQQQSAFRIAQQQLQQLQQQHEFGGNTGSGGGAGAAAGTLGRINGSGTDQSGLSKFLPCLKPFIPRQRLLYLQIHEEVVSLFLYNYTNEVVAKAREIVERATLWHNARSRLLREIGLHKMGITQLSTLKSADAKYNSYLLLTWMDPDTLVNHDYPVDSLTTPDFSNIPRIYAQLLFKLYRFADPAFVAKNISISPFEDQTQQMLALREDVRAMLNDHRLYMELHQQLMAKAEATLSEEVLTRLVSRCHLVHFVQTPLLFFPSWRRRIAAIRMGAADMMAALTVPCRKHSIQSGAGAAGGKSKAKPSQFPTGQSTITSATANTNSPSHRCSTAGSGSGGHISGDDEPCVWRIQQMLLNDYIDYLRSIGLSRLHIQLPGPVYYHHLFQAPAPSTASATAAQSSRHPSGVLAVVNHLQQQQYHQQQQQSGPSPTNASSPTATTASAAAGRNGGQWLCCVMEGGILFVHLSFQAPYFCVRMLQWNAQPQLEDAMNVYTKPSLDSLRMQQQSNNMHREQQQQVLRHFEHKKNELIRRSHVHSFVYDFHLRMVARYMVGDRQVLFNPGYNTNAFLVDLLQYYGCRPPHARNCVYEETVHCTDLRVSGNRIWEHFLNNEQHFGWRVVRLKSVEGGTATATTSGGIGGQVAAGVSDEFMLVAKEKRRAFELDYELVRVVINNSNSSKTAARILPTAAATLQHQQKGGFMKVPAGKTTTTTMPNGNEQQQQQISLKLYVLLVTEMMTVPFETNATVMETSSIATAAPITQNDASKCAVNLPPAICNGEVSKRGGITATAVPTHQQQQATAPISAPMPIPDGGEFTHVMSMPTAAHTTINAIFGNSVKGEQLLGTNNNLLQQQQQQQQQPLLLPCSTLVEQKEMEEQEEDEEECTTNTGGGGNGTELESFGEEEEEQEENEEENNEPDMEDEAEEEAMTFAPEETMVMDQEKEEDENEHIGGQQQQSAFLTSSILLPPPTPPLHHRQPSAGANFSASSQSLFTRQPVAILPAQLAQTGYCYECVIAAAAEISRTPTDLTAGGIATAASTASMVAAQNNATTAATTSRQRFCSGGLLLSGGGGHGPRNARARMSLPPSRTSTTSSSSIQQQRRFCRQRSDSSQLSACSSINSPVKKEQKQQRQQPAALVIPTGKTTAGLTPASSLKGLSEWRAAAAAAAAANGTTAFGTAAAADECDWTLFEEPIAAAESGQKLAIQRNNPPRRHRRKQSGAGQQQTLWGAGASSACLAGLAEAIVGRERGAVVPPEQVTYLHYLSSQQRRLQHLLEHEVRANRLAHFVAEADRSCYVDMLWKALLAASRTVPGQCQSKIQSGLFLSSATSSKSDFPETIFFGARSTPSSTSTTTNTTMSTSDHEQQLLNFEALLRVVGVEPAVRREPKLRALLHRVQWPRLCRFLVQYFEGERRCRYFESMPYSFLVITNPQFLDSAALFRHNAAEDTVEMFLLFKHIDHCLMGSSAVATNADDGLGTFASQSVHKLLEQVLSCLCAFLWSTLLSSPPSLS